jgi:hypothetical protein
MQRGSKQDTLAPSVLVGVTLLLRTAALSSLVISQTQPWFVGAVVLVISLFFSTLFLLDLRDGKWRPSPNTGPRFVYSLIALFVLWGMLMATMREVVPGEGQRGHVVETIFAGLWVISLTTIAFFVCLWMAFSFARSLLFSFWSRSLFSPIEVLARLCGVWLLFHAALVLLFGEVILVLTNSKAAELPREFWFVVLSLLAGGGLLSLWAFLRSIQKRARLRALREEAPLRASRAAMPDGVPALRNDLLLSGLLLDERGPIHQEGTLIEERKENAWKPAVWIDSSNGDLAALLYPLQPPLFVLAVAGAAVFLLR